MRNAKTLEAVHTHTHTHRYSSDYLAWKKINRYKIKTYVLYGRFCVSAKFT